MFLWRSWYCIIPSTIQSGTFQDGPGVEDTIVEGKRMSEYSIVNISVIVLRSADAIVKLQVPQNVRLMFVL